MRMNFGDVLNIQDLGNHSVATTVELGILLAGAVDATPDPKRKHFYGIEGGRMVYYVYVSPVSGIISLLASWESAASGFGCGRHSKRASSLRTAGNLSYIMAEAE
jgi:hypothetical protein